MKKIRFLLALLLCMSLAAAPMAVLAEEPAAVTLDLCNGPVDITPTGYSQNGGEEVAYTGDYIITGSLIGDTPLDFFNNTGSPVTFNITLDNAGIIGQDWCTALRFEGDSDITLNITNSGHSAIEAHGHSALRSNVAANVTVNITNPEGAELFLGRRDSSGKTDCVYYGNAPMTVTINGEASDNSVNYGTRHCYFISTKNCVAYDADGNVITYANAGDTVTVKPNSAPEGMAFEGWDRTLPSYKVSLSPSMDPETYVLTFTMPSSDVGLTAIYGAHLASITVTCDAPVVGGTPSQITYTTSPADIFTGEMIWWEVTENEQGEITWRKMESGDTFQLGCVYEVDLSDLKMRDPDAEFIIDEQTSILFNGKPGFDPYGYGVPGVFRWGPLRVYTITAGSTFTKGSGETVTVLAEDANPEELTGVLVDGEPLEQDCFTVKPETGAVTLTNSYLESLAIGEHTLTLVYTDGDAETTLTVEPAPEDSPETGDPILIVLMLAALSAPAALTVAAGKKSFHR